jgi:hypothetical protein
VSRQPDAEPAEGLAAMQSFFGDAIRQFVPLTERADLEDPIRSIIAGNDRLSPEEQAEIYREQFWLRHSDVLRDDFPGLRHLLGDTRFDELMRAYLSACPPNSYTLRDLGQRLAEFAAEYPDFPEQLEGSARDLARFELAFVDIFDGPEVSPIDAETVSDIPPDAWPSAKLTLRPLLTLLRLAHPVHRYRTAVKKAAADEEDVTLDVPPAEPTVVALWRGADLRVLYRSITAQEAAMVDALRGGSTLGEACATVAEGLDDSEQQALAGRLGAWFQGWAKRGWIVDVATGS